MADVIGPQLDALVADGRAADWWFLRKHPCWRIRILDADPLAAAGLFATLEADQVIVGWQSGIYEPETLAFGGTVGMDMAHGLFCADSRGVLAYMRCESVPVGRRELSVLLIGAMLAAAGLDWFERGDVFGRVAAMRPTPPDGACDKMAQLTRQLRALDTVPADALAATGELATSGASWLGAFREAGRLLAEAADRGALTRGLRAVLTHVLIFHWNRLGLSASTQGILSSAARTAYLPEALPVRGPHRAPERGTRPAPHHVVRAASVRPHHIDATGQPIATRSPRGRGPTGLSGPYALGCGQGGLRPSA
jgi:thiopeptide-type bacteriocin biosynthesis protein